MICKNSLKNFVTVLALLVSIVIISGEPECDELPVIRNGHLVLEDINPPYRVNVSIPYACDDWYKTDEINPKVTCLLTDNVANWTEGACKPKVISCGDPGIIENARRIGNSFSFPNNVTYICNEGYKMNGNPTRYCTYAARWEPRSRPTCDEILCEILIPPTNGEILPSNRHPDSVAIYRCEKYYKLVGDAKRTCLDNGTWSGSKPTCEKITCSAPKFPNGHIIGIISSVYKASDIVILQCNDGTHRISAKCMETGDWSVRPPICAGPTTDESTTVATTVVSEDNSSKFPNSCEDPGEINNGGRNIEGLHINGTVTYKCDEGYNLKGQSTLLCLENGKWNLDILPMCVKPLSHPAVVGIVLGVISFVVIILALGYLGYKYKMEHIRGFGEKSKALTADAADIEEIAGLDRTRIPVTVL